MSLLEEYKKLTEKYQGDLETVKNAYELMRKLVKNTLSDTAKVLNDNWTIRVNSKECQNNETGIADGFGIVMSSDSNYEGQISQGC